MTERETLTADLEVEFEVRPGETEDKAVERTQRELDEMFAAAIREVDGPHSQISYSVTAAPESRIARVWKRVRRRA